ncbi:hypothetical protein BJ944DRAFT_264292 [Cunninghamella echinulata]|nr:hypothetical protein BJ944DRAFT_264292 [Cunninghamella echinulata]
MKSHNIPHFRILESSLDKYTDMLSTRYDERHHSPTENNNDNNTTTQENSEYSSSRHSTYQTSNLNINQSTFYSLDDLPFEDSSSETSEKSNSENAWNNNNTLFNQNNSNNNIFNESKSVTAADNDTASWTKGQWTNTNNNTTFSRDRVKTRLVNSDRFEDLQSEAIHSWTNGIDLALGKPKPKKGNKGSWLTEEQFVSFSNNSSKLHNQEQQQQTISTLSKPSSEKYQSSSPNGYNQGSSIHFPTSNDLTNVNAINSNKDNGNLQQQQQQVIMKDKLKQTGHLIYTLLYDIENGLFGEPILFQFNEKLSYILQIIHSSVGSKPIIKLVDLLILALSCEKTQNAFSINQKSSTSYRYSTVSKQKSSSSLINDITDTIYNHATHFATVLMDYTRDYVWTPQDIQPVLELLVLLNRTTHSIIDPSQLSFLEGKVNQMKEKYSPHIGKEIFEQLQYSTYVLSMYICNRHPVSQQQYMSQIEYSSHWPKIPLVTSSSAPSSLIEKPTPVIKMNKPNTATESYSPSSIKHSDLSGSKWELPNQRKNSMHHDLEKYVKQHMILHKKQLDYIVQYALNTCYQLTVTRNALHGDSHWIFFHSVKQHVLTVLSPTIPDDAIVYEVEQQPIIKKNVIGHMVLLISEQDTNSMTFGTVIQEAYKKKSDGKTTQLFAIKHDRSTLQYDTFTLIITPIRPFILFTLIDWLKHALSTLDVSLFSPSLLPIFVFSPKKDKDIERLTENHHQDSHQYYDDYSRNNNDSADDYDQDEKHKNHKNRVPNYLRTYILDLSCIMAPNYNDCIAKVGEDSWPQLQEKYLRLPRDQQPELYALSSSQVSALQYALSHRCSIITGLPGTGKTHLASKITELSYQALKNESIHQPILVLASSETGLDRLLTKAMNTVSSSDIVRLGHDSEYPALHSRNGVRLGTFKPKDTLWKKYNSYIYELKTWRQQLKALEEHRYHINNPDPRNLVDLLPSKYRNALMQRFHHTNDTLEDICFAWLEIKPSQFAQDPTVASSLSITSKYNSTLSLPSLPGTTAYTNLLNNIAHKSTTIPPIIDRDHFNDQLQRMASYRPKVNPIANGKAWPFDDKRSNNDMDYGNRCRAALMNIWSKVSSSNLWHIQLVERKRLYCDLMKVYIQHIDMVIQEILKRQGDIFDKLENLRLKQWLNTCHFTRVIGITAEFAMTNHLFIREMAPRVVIVDEAHDIPEALILAIGLSARTEHLIIFGEEQEQEEGKDGFISSLGTSIIQRWRQSEHLVHQKAIQRLDTQMRIHPDIFKLWQVFSLGKNYHIYPPMNYALALKKEEPILGMVYNTYFVNYEMHDEKKQDEEEEKEEDKYHQVKKACQFVSFLTHYINQQGYTASELVVLTLCPKARKLIENYLLEIASKVRFINGLEKVKVFLVDNYKGKDAPIVVLFTDTIDQQPQHGNADSHSIKTNISLAISRAKNGLYIVGSNCLQLSSPCYPLASYMKENGLLSNSIPFKCQIHPTETYSASSIQDIISFENGGCEKICTKLLACGHCCQEKCHPLSHSSMKCIQPCERERPSYCHHRCINTCYTCTLVDKCPPCLDLVNIELPCGHQVSAPCHLQSKPSAIQCQEQVAIELKCGHPALVPCQLNQEGDFGDIFCHSIIEKVLDCHHIIQEECSGNALCTEICSGTLECGHPCQQLCRTNHGHDRSLCTRDCPKQLICGHYCTKGCNNPDDHTERCLKDCSQKCSHGYICGNKCWDVCISCIEKCPNQCPHYTCSKKCHEMCDRPTCNEICGKILACGHKCRGYCGEPCTICPECNPDLICPITLTALSTFSESDMLYTLPECGCTFSAEGLDSYFNSHSTVGEHTTVKLWSCPSCQKLVYTALRYNKHIKKEVELVNEIKRQQERIRQQLTSEERVNIINAMNQEINPTIHNIVGGRWFVCKNQHPYFIGDCGGATEVSQCPHCNEQIGGLQHKVLDSNRFYGEFDGSQKPAWPGQPGQIEEVGSTEEDQLQ